MIVEYCDYIVVNSGIDIFVIDREINSQSIAAEFECRGWGLLSMLDSNQYKELSDWDYEFVGGTDEWHCSKELGWRNHHHNERLYAYNPSFITVKNFFCRAF